MQSYWHHVDHASLLAPDYGTNLQGWSAIEDDTRTRFKNDPDPGLGKIDHKDHVIHIEGDRAFVQYKEDVVFPSKVKGEPFVVKYYEVRRMIKVDGQWKIVNMISALLTEEMRPADVLTHLRWATFALKETDQPKEAAQVGGMITKWFPDSPIGYSLMGQAAMKQKTKRRL